jgi:hypothetical protein
LIDDTPSHLAWVESQVEHHQIDAKLSDDTVRVLPMLLHEDLVTFAFERLSSKRGHHRVVVYDRDACASTGGRSGLFALR